MIKSGWYKKYLKAEWSKVKNEKIIKKYLKEHFSNNNISQGLFITGAIGTGKTSLLALISMQLFKKYRMTQNYIHSPLMFQKYYDKENNIEIENITRCGFLFIDDFGKEYSNPYTLSQFYSLIEYRYANNKPIFFSSNLSIDDLEAKAGYEQIADRIRDTSWMSEIVMFGKSKRSSNEM